MQPACFRGKKASFMHRQGQVSTNILFISMVYDLTGAIRVNSTVA